jgi:hypothetical protein
MGGAAAGAAVGGLIGGDEALDIVMRIYAPDLERMKSWKTPKAEKVEAK